MKTGRVVPEIRSQTESQTRRQTDTLVRPDTPPPIHRGRCITREMCSRIEMQSHASWPPPWRLQKASVRLYDATARAGIRDRQNYNSILPRLHTLHRESKKTRHQTLGHNFTNYYPIFKSFSLADSVVNLQQTHV